MYRLRVRLRHRRIYIVCMVMVHLTVRMGSLPFLPVKRTVTIGTMLKLDGDGDEHEVGDGTSKQTLTF